MAIVKVDSAKETQLPTFSEMGMGVIGVVVDAFGEHDNVLVMKVSDGGSGVVIMLDGSDMWSCVEHCPLRVRVLGKEELVELSNE